MQINSVSSVNFESKSMLKKIGLSSMLAAAIMTAGYAKDNRSDSPALNITAEQNKVLVGNEPEKTFSWADYSQDTVTKPGKPRYKSKGDEGVSNNFVTRMYGEAPQTQVKDSVPNVEQNIKIEKEEVVVEDKTPKEETVQTGKDPFNAEAFNKRISEAKYSADVVKAQTDALNIGIELRNRATKVDLAEMKQYSGVDENGNPTEKWTNYVKNYIEHNFMYNNNIESTEVKGIEYDVNKTPLKDRILTDKDKNGNTLEDVLKNSSLPEHLKRETATGDKPGINLSNVEGVNVLNLKNLTLENTNEQIGKVGESLRIASDKIDESLIILRQKLQASKENVTDQNNKIATQIITANSALNIIKSYVKVSKDDQEFLTEYAENKAKIDNMKKPVTDEEGNEIGKEEYTSYQPFGRYQFAREAEDKQIITTNFDNLRFGKTQNGNYVVDYVNIPAEEKAVVEGAMTRLMAKYPNIKDQLNSFGNSCEQIRKSRQGVIDGLKDVAKYEVLLNQLGEINQKLTAKSSTLLSISQNLEEIDTFNEAADKKAENMYQSEKTALTKATERADYKVGRTDEKGNQSREVLDEDKDNTKYNDQDGRRSRKAGQKAAEGKKESDKAATRVLSQMEASTAVAKHDRAVFDYNDALDAYKPVTAKAIKSEADVPENLKEQYKVAVNQFSDFNLELYGNTIRVKDKETNEVKYVIDENTTTAQIKQM